MNVGMMWFDSDPKKPLAQKIGEAAERYQKKYGEAPDACRVPVSMLAETELQIGRVSVRPMRSILPGHLWIGIDDPHPGLPPKRESADLGEGA
jgi:hypothetical protein